jgi:hypothetical protein
VAGGNVAGTIVLSIVDADARLQLLLMPTLSHALSFRTDAERPVRSERVAKGNIIAFKGVEHCQLILNGDVTKSRQKPLDQQDGDEMSDDA